MTRIGLVSAALSALVTSFVAPASEASPPTPGPRGRLCSYLVVPYVVGGPMVWDRNFWLHCHAQVVVDSHTGPIAPGGDVHGPSYPHDGDAQEDEVAVVSGVVIEPPDDLRTYVCTSVSWPTSTGPNWLYWHPPDGQGTVDPSDDQAGHWTTTNTTPCEPATRITLGPLIDEINDVLIEHVDPKVCLALAQLHADQTETWGDKHDHDGPNPGQQVYVDAEGDVFLDDGDGLREDDWRDDLWWDCPRYLDYEANPVRPGPDGAAGGVIDI